MRKDDTRAIDKKIELIQKYSKEWDIISLYAFRVVDYPEKSQLNILFRNPSFADRTVGNSTNDSSNAEKYNRKLYYIPPYLSSRGRKGMLALQPSYMVKKSDGAVYYYSFGANGHVGYLKEIDSSEWKP